MKRKLQLKVNILLFTKIFVFGAFLLLYTPQALASQSIGDNTLIIAQINEARISINVQNATIKTILYEINKQTKINFIYKDQEIRELPTRSINLKNVTVKQLLDTLFKDTDFTYSFVDNNIAITKKPIAKTAAPKETNQTKIVVNGLLLDAAKKPIVGATIQVVGTYQGAITAEKGDFSLSVTPGTEIEISCTGKKTMLKTLNKTETNLIITMEDDAVAMDDVVVNGYFNKSKTSYTGAAKSFNKEELRKVSNQNILSTLSMIDPSFKMMENNLMGSNPNSMPNFTIRGGADFQGVVDDTRGSRNMPLFVLDGFVVPMQQIYDLDPNRVESVTILKDAAATAIYGSRASNGVVIVETVRMEKGKIRLTYTGDVNFEMPDITCYNVLNSEEKLQYEVIAGLYKESGIPWFDESKRHLYNSRKKFVEQGYNTDWLNKPINSLGVGHKHSALIEGGDDNFTYGMMLNYEDKKGVMKESNRERLGINVKFQYRYKNLKLKNDLGFQRVTANDSPYGNFSTYVSMNPYYPYLDDKGNYKKVLAYNVDAFGEETTAIVNPLYNGTLFSIDRNIADRLTNNFQIEWDIIESLKLKSQFSISKDWTTDDQYKSDKHTDYEDYVKEDLFRKGQYKKGNGSAISYSFNAIASYNKSFGDHFISLNAGLDIIQDKNEYLSYLVEGVSDISAIPSMGLQYYPGSTPTGSDGIKRSIGVFANASYTWQNKYLVDFSYRTDASSVYGKNNRWGGFWSAGIGWNLHKEDFLKENEVINFLKVRASTGIVGGDNFYEYQALKTYRFMNSMRYENWQGVDIVGIDNPNLKWQRKLKTNVGTEFELFRSRLKGSFDYYWETSSDNMTDVALPPSLGFSSYKDNLGKVTNKGIELSLNYKYIDTKDFQSNFFINLIRNVNTVKEISKELVAFNKIQDSNVDNRPLVRYIEGESENTLWAVPSLGIDPATGDELFLNRYGKVTRVWDANDYLPMGCKDPKLEGSFGNTFSYKGLQLNLYFSYRFGADIYNETLVNKVENSDANKNVDRRAFDQGWKKEGDVSFYKRPGSTKTEPTSRFIEKENYLKLGSINVSYYLPSELCKSIKLQTAKVTLFMNDIATWSSVKQERGIEYPFARNISVSLQLTF